MRILTTRGGIKWTGAKGDTGSQGISGNQGIQGIQGTPGGDLYNTSINAVVTKTGNATLTSSDKNTALRLADVGAQSITLPAANAIVAGAKIYLFNDTAASGTTPIQHTISKAGSDTIVGSIGSLTSFILLTGNYVLLESDGVSKWYIRDGNFDTSWISGGANIIT